MSLSRRKFHTLAASGVLATAALSACGSEETTSGDSASDGFGDIEIQLSYIKNYEFTGQYLAIDNGHFADAGFGTVTLTAGGSSATNAEAQVASGQSFIGIGSPLITAPAILAGAEIKLIGAGYQKNPFSVMSLTASGINGPADLKGKTVAVGDFNSLVWQAFLAANELTDADVSTIPYSDGPSQIASNQADAYLGYTTAYTGTAGQDGQPTSEFLLADNGLPIVAEAYIASVETIENDREKLKAALVAQIQGWNDSFADPDAAVAAAVDNYGKDQDLDTAVQLRNFTKQQTLMVTPDTEANGLLTVTPELVAATVTGLGLAGIEITAEELFDTTVLAEVYEENPDLI